VIALLTAGVRDLSTRADSLPQERGASQPAAQKPSFVTDIQPILKAKCQRCHGDKVKKADLDLRTLAGALRGGESGPAVVLGKPDQSLLYEKVHTGAMPPAKKERLTPAEVSMIRRWLEDGASESSRTASTVDQLTGRTPAKGTVTQEDIIPILLRRCTVCHGPREREGGLDLRSKAAMLRGGKSGPAFVSGDPKQSLILRKIHAGEMPPLRRIIEVSIKPIEPAEVELLTRWIAAGAPEVVVEPEVAANTPDPLVNDKDRDFWAFRSPQPVRIPKIQRTEQIRNPIDAFILHRLESAGLILSAEADRASLLRRVYLDLTGLPPQPADVQAFLADSDPLAYERVVDRLLASPRYGERWARHWLDLAGYADSEGKREQDLDRPAAYRYRDYVIRSLNADKPYDRFLLEQLAGDELADYEHAAVITSAMYDNLVATGFLRMAPDPTWYQLTNFIPDRLEVIADEIDVLGSAVMGLTLKCARCHSHKFDPIPQRDYYRLLAIFKGAFDEHDWMKSNWLPGLSMGTRCDRDLPYVSTAERQQWQTHNLEMQKEIDRLRSELDRQAAEVMQKVLEARLAQLPDEIRGDVGTALALPAGRRNEVQTYLVAKFDKRLLVERSELIGIDAGFKKLTAATEQRIQALAARRLPEPKVRALWDRGEPSPTYIYRRGDYLSPGRLVGPGVPSVLTDGKTPFVVEPPWPGAPKTGRRLAFARWLTQPDHPLTARVMVNRLWKHHFGSGLVKSLDNFGKAGARPSHPELLDWLAREFIHQGWSLKAMDRLMVTSTTYRQVSQVSAAQEKLDPGNTLYSRMPLQRLSAEQLYDALLVTAGCLDSTFFGPSDAVSVRGDGLVTPAGTARGWRRLLYVRQQRKQLPTHLENFDYPQMNPNCTERRDSTVAPQALHLFNNGLVQQLAESFAYRVRKEAGADPANQIDCVYLIALGRPPSAEEAAIARAALVKLKDRWSEAGSDKANPEKASLHALATFCHALMNSAAFLYVD
jgi:mono/diheme cytochrome c family protein